jgi:SAM-dependent methyltransferase
MAACSGFSLEVQGTRNRRLGMRLPDRAPQVTPVIPPLGFLWRELWCDRSVQRAGMNWILRQWQRDLRGVVLDLGCGTDPSGVGKIARGNGASYIGLDIDLEVHPNVAADLNDPLPFGANVADTVVIANCFYIVRRPNRLLEEAHRILKPRGNVFLMAPLVWQYYPGPKDYWRFTAEAVELLLREAGFEEISIVSVGGRWTSSAHLISPFIHPGRSLRPLVHLAAVALDRLFAKLLPRVGPVPLVYCAKARRA